MAARAEPSFSETTAPFWTGGARGELRIMRCRACQLWIHPPKSSCPRCWSAEVSPDTVSGQGSIWSFTYNRLAPDGESGDAPIVAEVQLPEQPGLRLLTNIVKAALSDVQIGMAVHVEFERAGDAWIPVFAP
jgi:uncharacterized protein